MFGLFQKIGFNKEFMNKYLVRFTTKSGDYDKEWVHASSPDEAEQIIRSEHWNIASVDMVTEI